MRKQFILIKQELNQRRRSFILWVLGWSLVSFLFASLFESFKETFAENNPFAELEGNALFQAFGVSSDYFTNIERYVSGEFLISFVLMGGIFAAYLGADTLAGKIEDKTISNLLSKNLTRTQIYFSKVFALTIYIFSTTILIGGITYIGFRLFTNQEDISEKFFILSFLAAFLMQYLFLYFGILVGIVLDKSRAILFGISFLIFSWLISSLSEINGFPKLVEYISPYFYIDFDQITDLKSVDPLKILLIFVIIAIFAFAGWKSFKDKDIQV